MASRRCAFPLALIALLALPASAAADAPRAAAGVARAVFSGPPGYVVVEILRDDVVHVETAAGPAPVDGPIATSPMVAKRDYAGPTQLARSGPTFTTARLRVQVDPASLCVGVRDLQAGADLTTICPQNLGGAWKGLTFTRGAMTHVYGLGQKFKQLGSADGSWTRLGVRDSGPFGNTFEPFGPAGLVGNVQIPVFYALGPGTLTYGVLLDNVYKQTWSFSADPFRVDAFGDQLRYYVLAGKDLPAVRTRFMELTGTPPVPPRKAFGLWVSEFGYRTWSTMDQLAAGLRTDAFPLDGFVLDLFWFGGIQANSPDTAMGRLNWDTRPAAFPDPAANVARMAADHLGLVTIEESYIGEHTDTFAAMSPQGLLAFQATGAAAGATCPASGRQPVFLSEWFGKAGMVDWSNPAAGAFIHDQRRLPNIVRAGVLGHWLDLGEPEKFDASACYQGVETTAAGKKDRHPDVHNLYALLWEQSVFDGYRRHGAEVNRRPFLLARSGAAGAQRFGVAMWSGDIGSNLDILASHENAQLQMSLSGIDYYGADTGGFRREGMPCNADGKDQRYEKELFTQWFADAAWFDVPVRPHTDNSFQQGHVYATAPDLVGDLESNRENIRQRYALLPYYVSLAHRAFRSGEPVMPPLVYQYQADPAVRDIGHEKLLGKDLLVAVVAHHGEHARSVYFPGASGGEWVDLHTRAWFPTGAWVPEYPVYLQGRLTLPAFARGGAIIPEMHVDAQTLDAFGARKDGSVRDELVVRAFAGKALVGPGAARASNGFTVFEDDGATVKWGADGRPSYDVRTTELTLATRAGAATVTIAAAAGTYAGAPAHRNNVVRLVTEDAKATAVTLDGAALAERLTAQELEDAPAGWRNAGRNLVEVKTGDRPVSAKKTLVFTLGAVAPAASLNFVCDNAWTRPGETIHAVGDIAALGSWNPAAALALSPSIAYPYVFTEPRCGPGPFAPTWTGVGAELPPGATVQWKCVKHAVDGSWIWQPGPNNVVRTPASGFGGTTRGGM